ncbi:hypothetical protein GGX14DRAFT_390383 [Mycena pura]|uniref:Uncharacterized protein n=1 Tax=Mycena pura TaxID=153505 RepID=A0AAD6VW20_9AGAR|nr:hypothetical protein GGX14DRAFT_390383 [Mycena pura]
MAQGHKNSTITTSELFPKSLTLRDFFVHFPTFDGGPSITGFGVGADGPSGGNPIWHRQPLIVVPGYGLSARTSKYERCTYWSKVISQIRPEVCRRHVVRQEAGFARVGGGERTA